MKLIDIVVDQPRTYKGVLEAHWNHTQTKILVGRGNFIDIKSEANCWQCRKSALLGKFNFYCSTECREVGEAAEDAWRNE